MSGTLLEQTLSDHAEVEHLEKLIVMDLQREMKSRKQRLYQNHRIRNMLDSIMTTTSRLMVIYEDKDHARQDEIASLGGQNATGHNVFSVFYDRLKEIREYHRRHPNAKVIDPWDDAEELLQEEPWVDFTGEEANGKFLDMHELYNQYLNSKFGKVMDYSSYLDEFPHTHRISPELKLTDDYSRYLSNLVAYLRSFFERTQPLQDLEKILSKVELDFEDRWKLGNIDGWQGKDEHANNTESIIDLDDYESVDELVELGLEKLKQALMALGLKAGGTVQQRAERLFLTKYTPLELIDRKHFASAKGLLARPEKLKASREITLQEAKIQRLCELLHEAIEETKAHIEKKQSLTYEEMEAEREEEEEQAESDSDEEHQQIYNPLKLPMGWDGNPIPYWLYKLHGLGQEFKCEICGNSSYWGRRAFERHFKEWRHQHGMRRLGIPNTKNFREITIIKDAEALWEKIQERQAANKWRPDLEEEYEDQDGNVYNKKTYIDLQRQGLI